jgi:glycosyltransferase involved in cell wall biosynthesis
VRVYVFPADEHGCGHYRLIWPAQELIKQGHDIRVVLPKDRADLIKAEIDDATNEPVYAYFPEDADVIVLQRITHTYLAKTIPLIRARGCAVVIDMDDDLSRIDPANPAFAAMHPRRVKAGQSEHSWNAAELACRNATLAQVSTPALLRRYAPHGRGQVLRNCVPEWYLNIAHEDSTVIGYAGALTTHSNDVPLLGSSVARLQIEGLDFMTIGEATNVERLLGLTRPATSLGPVSFTEWPTALTRLGIGLAPLANTEFNRAKSWLKMLEMAAVGVPCVGSARAEYQALHRLGVGLLVDKPKDWYRTIRRIAHDAVEREELAARGREAVRSLTVERQAYLWWETWKLAYEYEQTFTAAR